MTVLDAYGRPFEAQLMLSAEWMKRRTVEEMITRAAEARVRQLHASLSHITMGDGAGDTIVVKTPKRYDVSI